jgi:hypothetical protein
VSAFSPRWQGFEKLGTVVLDVVHGLRHGAHIEASVHLRRHQRAELVDVLAARSSHSARVAAAMAMDIRSSIRPTLSVAAVVMIVYVGMTRFGSLSGSDLSYQTSYSPASASVDPSTGRERERLLQLLPRLTDLVGR